MTQDPLTDWQLQHCFGNLCRIPFCLFCRVASVRHAILCKCFISYLIMSSSFLSTTSYFHKIHFRNMINMVSYELTEINTLKCNNNECFFFFLKQGTGKLCRLCLLCSRGALGKWPSSGHLAKTRQHFIFLIFLSLSRN